MKKVVSFTLDEDLLNVIRKNADNLKVSVSSYVTLVLREELMDNNVQIAKIKSAFSSFAKTQKQKAYVNGFVAGLNLINGEINNKITDDTVDLLIKFAEKALNAIEENEYE